MKRVREGMMLSRKRLASILGVNPMTVYRWEMKKKVPTIVELAIYQVLVNKKYRM